MTRMFDVPNSDSAFWSEFIKFLYSNGKELDYDLGQFTGIEELKMEYKDTQWYFTIDRGAVFEVGNSD